MKIKDFIFGCGILGGVVTFPTIAKSVEINFRNNWLKSLHAANSNRRY